MKLPRGLSGRDLAKALRSLGYTITRQTGSHLRLTCEQGGQHHVTVPAHRALKVGTMVAILDDVARHHGMSQPDLLEKLFG